MKTAIIALSAAALIVTAPAVLAQGVKTPALQHKLSKTHHAGVSGHGRPHEMRARGAGGGSPGAFGYPPGEAHGYLDRDLEVSGRQAGGMGGM